MADGQLAVSMQNESRSARPLFAHLRDIGDPADSPDFDPGGDAAGGAQIRHGEFPLARDNHASLPI